jgi:hypothetical protein
MPVFVLEVLITSGPPSKECIKDHALRAGYPNDIENKSAVEVNLTAQLLAVSSAGSA